MHILCGVLNTLVYLTHTHRAADSVVEATHVIHLAAVCGVMEHRGGKEAEVVRRSGDVHISRKRDCFTCGIIQKRLIYSAYAYESHHIFNCTRPWSLDSA